MSATVERWAEFYLTQRRALTTYALSLTGNPADAQDLIQDVLVRMVRETRPLNDARGYVLRCMRNLAIDRHRQRRRQPGRTALQHGGLAFLDAEAVRRNEAFEHARAALAALATVQREIIVLKIYGELTFREIAEILTCPLGTVASHYARGIAELRTLLQAEPRHA
jgi:RNA polymerase sigma-70 factor (ECF subfamily)